MEFALSGFLYCLSVTFLTIQGQTARIFEFEGFKKALLIGWNVLSGLVALAAAVYIGATYHWAIGGVFYLASILLSGQLAGVLLSLSVGFGGKKGFKGISLSAFLVAPALLICAMVFLPGFDFFALFARLFA